MDKINPVDVILGLLIKGMFLGIILFIAWPTKLLLDKVALTVFHKVKELPRKKVKVKVKAELAE